LRESTFLANRTALGAFATRILVTAATGQQPTGPSLTSAAQARPIAGKLMIGKCVAGKAQ
jgi:hypothetical protein